MNKDASIVKLVETYMRDATRAAKGPKDFRLISSTRENFYRMLARKKLYIDKLKLTFDVGNSLLPLLKDVAGYDAGTAPDGSSGDVPLEFNETLAVKPEGKSSKIFSISVVTDKTGKGKVTKLDTPSTSQKPAYNLRPKT